MTFPYIIGAPPFPNTPHRPCAALRLRVPANLPRVPIGILLIHTASRRPRLDERGCTHTYTRLASSVRSLVYSRAGCPNNPACESKGLRPTIRGASERFELFAIQRLNDRHRSLLRFPRAPLYSFNFPDCRRPLYHFSTTAKFDYHFRRPVL